MAAKTRPPGRLPSRVYWVRRLLVLGVALALVFGIVRLLGTGGDGSLAAVTAGGSPSPTPPPVSDAAPARTRSGSPPPSAKVLPSGAAAADERGKGPRKDRPLALPEGPCEPSDIKATPVPKGPAYGGEPVTFRVELTSTGPAACTWNASASSMVVKLTSGDDRIWSTQDCPEAIEPTGVVVRRAVPGVVRVTWHGLRSDAECTNKTAYALAGWYYVEAAAYGSEPTRTQFELEEPVRPTITAKPSPSSSAKTRPPAP